MSGQLPGRVALVISTMEGGGAQRALLKLADGLAARGERVDLVLGRAQGAFLEQVPRDVRVVDLGVSRMAAAVPPLVRYLRVERPAVMLTALDYVNVVATWARSLARVPVRLIVTERNTLSIAIEQTTRRSRQWMPALCHRFYPWADAIVAVSGGVADDLARTARLPRRSIDVIYNPVVTPETARLRSAPAEHPWLRDGGPPVVLAVGRFVPQKDQATLVRAFAAVRGRRPARLLLLGDGPGRAELEGLVRDHGLCGDVDLPGFDSNPYPAMARAPVFVLPSRWEGLPGVLVEALFCGARVVATDCPSGPEEILQAGRHGQLVPVGDADAMAHAIERALAEEVPRPAENSWRPFEQDVVVDRYLRLMRGAS
jgi:glycosyltransferase involved in cell wall biosynthesis